MRILVTGCTSQQIGRGTKLGYEPVIDLYVKALRDLGHTVDHRPVDLDAEGDFKTYDRVFVGLVPAGSMAATYLIEALVTLHRARDRATVYVDDWNFPAILGHLRGCRRWPRKRIMAAPVSGNRQKDWARKRKNWSELRAALDRTAERWPTVLIPRYAWGSNSLGEEFPADVVHLDPTGYARSYTTLAEKMRTKRWVLGTVSDQRKWLDSLNLRWPVVYAGGTASKAEVKFQEADLVQLYQTSWGVLSPPYKRLFGTGWWRNRFLYAARHGAVLLCDPQEAPQLGEPYGQAEHRIETWAINDLRELARSQHRRFFRSVWGPKEMQLKLMEVLD
jgi:hypothetical protein